MVRIIVEDWIVLDQLDNDLEDVWRNTEHVLEATMLLGVLGILPNEQERGSFKLGNGIAWAEVSSRSDSFEHVHVGMQAHSKFLEI